MRSFDCIIIGGGVLGCAIAWYRAKDGASVALLERCRVAGANSSRAAGLLSRARSKVAVIPLVAETFAAIAELEGELGEPLGLSQVGSLHVASSAGERANLAELARVSAEGGVLAEWLDRDDALRAVPWLATDLDVDAVFFPGDGFIDPNTLVQAYARAARARGAQLWEGVDVTAIRLDGDRVLGVETSQGFMAGDVVVDAAGAWAATLARPLGIGLPTAPVRSQYWITAPHLLFRPGQPMVLLPDARAYTRPEGTRLLFGLREAVCPHVDPWEVPADLGRLRLSQDPGGWDSLGEGIPALARFVPLVEQVGIANYISGLSTYTPDGMFALGAMPGVRGFLAATGCCGAGMAASGGIGLALARLAAHQPPPFDLGPHRIDRFGPVDPADARFRQLCADARSLKRSG
jgi:4-methylaminobutanoate oxidase (formaldehyde-forming)